VRSGFVFTRRTSGGASERPARRLADAIRGRSAELDVATLASRAVLGSPLAMGATLYQGVRAEYVCRDPLPPRDEPRARTAAEAALQLRRALEAAVAHTLRGARRVAVATGGGLDSSALLALACRWARDNGATVFGIALDFEGPGDDRPYLRAVEQHLGCEVVRFSPEDAARHGHLIHTGVDAAPFTWPGGGMGVEKLARARELGADVMLTGIGADELLDGVPQSLGRLARRGHVLRAVRSARAMRGFEPAERPLVQWILRPFVSSFIPRSIHALRVPRGPQDAPSWAGPVLLDYLRGYQAALRDRIRGRRVEGPWAVPYHEHLAWLRHQEEVAGGLERRQPYLEPSVRALVASFDPVWLVHGDIRRGLFREAIRDLLPASVVERPDKASFETASARFTAAIGGLAEMRPLVTVKELASLGIVEPKPFREAFEQFERAPTEEGMGWESVWPALAVEAFLRGRRASQTIERPTSEERCA
jgi:asparagine synthetase B (glutamine-hydrolysing)